MSLYTQFKTKPEMLEKSLSIIRDEFKKIGLEVNEEDFVKVKEYMVKLYTKSLKENPSWSKSMANYQLCPVDSFVQDLEVIEKITPQDVSIFMQKVMNQGNYQVIVLGPEKYDLDLYESHCGMNEQTKFSIRERQCNLHIFKESELPEDVKAFLFFL